MAPGVVDGGDDVYDFESDLKGCKRLSVHGVKWYLHSEVWLGEVCEGGTARWPYSHQYR